MNFSYSGEIYDYNCFHLQSNISNIENQTGNKRVNVDKLIELTQEAFSNLNEKVVNKKMSERNSKLLNDNEYLLKSSISIAKKVLQLDCNEVAFIQADLETILSSDSSKADKLIGIENTTKKVIDFGEANLASDVTLQNLEAGQLVMGVVRNVPENQLGMLISTKSDVYNAGLVLLRMCCSSHEFMELSNPETYLGFPIPMKKMKSATQTEINEHLRGIDSQYQERVKNKLSSLVQQQFPDLPASNCEAFVSALIGMLKCCPSDRFDAATASRHIEGAFELLKGQAA